MKLSNYEYDGDKMEQINKHVSCEFYAFGDDVDGVIGGGMAGN
jgi:hypothetical protein